MELEYLLIRMTIIMKTYELMRVACVAAALFITIFSYAGKTGFNMTFAPGYGITSYWKVTDDKDHIKHIEKMRKQAYKYRTDISKEVLNVAKKHRGIIYGDWIAGEGKAWDLEGNEMFPELGFSQVGRFNDSLYMMKKRAYEKDSWGIVNKEGKIVIPFEYGDFSDFDINYGIIYAVTGSGYRGEGTIAVYTLDGACLFKLSARPTSDYLMYNPQYNIFMLEQYWGKEVEGNYLTYAYYTDGNLITKEPIHASASNLNITSTTITANNGKEVVSWSPRHDIPTFMRIDIDACDAYYHAHNKWYEMFVDYFAKGDYKSALFCATYFKDFEAPVLRHVNPTDPEYVMSIGMLECMYQLKDYNTLHSIFTFPRILEYALKEDGTYVGYGSKEICQKYLEPLNNLRKNSIAAYNRKLEQRQRTAEIFAGIFAGVVSSISRPQYSGGRASTVTGSTVSPSNTGGSVTSSSSSSSSSSSKSSVTRKTCPRCNGKKTVVNEHSIHVSQYGIKVDRVTCSECGKSYDKTSMSHKHQTCSECHGTGYYEIR